MRQIGWEESKILWRTVALCSAITQSSAFSRQSSIFIEFNPLSSSVKLQILLLCLHTFLTEVVGRSC